MDLPNVMLFTSRVFRSLGKKEAPEDFKSLKRGEISSFKRFDEKLDSGDALEISVAPKDVLSHFEFKKDFLFHLLFKADLSGF
jgi:hypothetical protein